MDISCNICKYGELCSYYAKTYYCKNPQHYRCGDFSMEENCEYGEFSESKYYNKYHVSKNLDNTSKKLVNKNLEDLLFGIRLKNIDEIVQEIKQILDEVNSYRVPNKCETCAKEYCEYYANGYKNCDKWE